MLIRRLRYWLGSRKRAAALREEMELHLEEKAAELREDGLDEAAASAEARRRFGNVVRKGEESREIWIVRWWSELGQDVGFGLRALGRTPGFLTAAVLCLGLGIGATTTVLGVANAVIFRGLPYPDADRLLALYEQRPQEGVFDNVVSYADFLDWREQNRVFSAMASWEGGATAFTYTSDGEPERVPGALVTGGFFDVLAVPPRIGRAFTAEDEAPGAPRIAIVTDGFWRRGLGADEAALGRDIMLDGRPYTVAGILPAEFEAPFHQWEIFIPLRFDAAARDNRGNHSLNVLARLRADVTLEQARADMAAISQALESEHPVNRGHAAYVAPMTDALRGEMRPAALALLAAAGLVMLIACFNVANLLLARAVTRLPEMSLRLALGAGRGRILRQLLTEGLLLSLLGAGLGVMLAAGGVLLIRRFMPVYAALNPDGIRLDLTVLGATMSVALLCGLLFGLAPAFGSRRSHLPQVIRSGGRQPSSTPGRARRLSAIVVAETALAVMLLVGAGLLLRSFWELQSVDPGFRAERVLALQLRLPAPYSTPAQHLAFQDALVERMQALPGVVGVGLTSFLPMSGEDSRQGLVIEGVEPDPDLGPRRANWRLITPGYIETMQIPLLQGRLFEDRDVEGAPLVMLVNETAARLHWPGRDPVGSRARLSGIPDFATVVGVVGDVRHQGPEQTPVPEAYLAFKQYPFPVMSLVVRTESEPETLLSTVRQQLREIDRNLPPVGIGRMEDVVDRTFAPRRFLTFLVLGFAALALMLAGGGVYAQLAYSVSRQKHDLGVRMALGARREQVVGMVVRQGLGLALLGTILGLAGAAALSRTMQQLLFGIEPLDAATLAAAAAVLLAAAALACVVPARRAAQTDPAVALRHD